MGLIDAFYSYKVYLFDLDNTLYDENRYLFESYKLVAKNISDITKIAYEEVFTNIINIFIRDGRSKLFDRLIECYALQGNSLNEFLEILRTITLEEKLVLFHKVKFVLKQLLEANKKIIIVTNGNPIQQQNKIRQIEWEGINNKIVFVYANEIVKKPSLKLFMFLKSKYNLIEGQTIMIGDSIIDETFASNSKISFINIKSLS